MRSLAVIHAYFGATGGQGAFDSYDVQRTMLQRRSSNPLTNP